MKKLIIFTLLFLSGMEIMSRISVKPIEFYDVPLRKGFVGFAFYPVIMYKYSKDVVNNNLNKKFTRIHELKHHEQAERHGFISYKLQYAFNQFTMGYDHNHFEIEAYAAELVRPIKKRK